MVVVAVVVVVAMRVVVAAVVVVAMVWSWPSGAAHRQHKHCEEQESDHDKKSLRAVV